MVATKEKKNIGHPLEAARPAAKMTKHDLETAAYFHWLGRGCPSDDSLSDWIAMEKKWGNESISLKMDVQA